MRVIQRGSVACCRVGGSDDGGAVRCDGAIDVGSHVSRGKVNELERLSKHHSIVHAHAGSGGRVDVFGASLKERKGGAVGGATREVRLVSNAECVGASVGEDSCRLTSCLRNYSQCLRRPDTKSAEDTSLLICH